MNVIRPGSLSVTAAADSQRMNFDSRNEQIITQKVRINDVFIGDSNIRFWDLQLYFRESDKKMINRGIEGDTPLFIAKRFEADVIQLQPDTCVYQAGAAELVKLDGNIWMAEQPLPEEKVIKNITDGIKSVAELCRKNKIRFVVCSLMPQQQYQNTILKVNKKIENISEKTEMIFLDVYKYFVDKHGKIKELFSDDGVSLNPAGYKYFTELIYEYV